MPKQTEDFNHNNLPELNSRLWMNENTKLLGEKKPNKNQQKYQTEKKKPKPQN